MIIIYDPAVFTWYLTFEDFPEARFELITDLQLANG